MSAITSLVDSTPLLPQNLFEWREVIQYASSIGFSFITGMLLGALSLSKRQRTVLLMGESSVIKGLLGGLGSNPLSPVRDLPPVACAIASASGFYS